ncbi:hypothetical protein HUK80_14975 [Flavobacterium sp. MAH-1]|uniref:Uncharacterized protein n=1 Tax=Flavobacterium agri TaxID=2743471 RepID=A0A7Y9C7C1_9FLAO|nr:hypothetical protein [Flavobacterium agri]NUY82205.1 hypothetical protein [Flavobacterium agri]NYA72229.1 hypothetical protein [Flavobacterium agri]
MDTIRSGVKEEEVEIDSCTNENYRSILREIPDRSTNAYELTITSKNHKLQLNTFLDVRPKMSRITYCNDLCTVVGFACGGPCYSRVFVFTDKNRPQEQYEYAVQAKNSINFISHIEDEDFEHLIIRNLSNSKTMTVDVPDMNLWVYGQPDSIIVKKQILMLYYQAKNQKQVSKRVSLKPIL